MKDRIIAAVICEYNPFHLGHEYLLTRVREEIGALGVIVAVMSGNFTQRGEAAILPPHARARMAMAGDADLVLELPFPYAASSARYFASAGVSALASLGCDALAFGSECADREALVQAAMRLDSEEYAANFATRDAKTGDAAAHFAALGSTPASNDILAVEYVRTLLKGGWKMEVCPIQRVGSAYRDACIDGEYPSASAIRAAHTRGEEVTPLLPLEVRALWREALEENGGVADTAKLGCAMLARLRSGEDFSSLADCGGGLDAHLRAAALKATDFASLCRIAATKRYTDGRIRRALLYLLAGVTRADLEAPPAYLRLLAANEKGRAFLAEGRKNRTVAVVTKPADIAALGAGAERARALGAIAEGLYALCLPRPIVPAELATRAPLML